MGGVAPNGGCFQPGQQQSQCFRQPNFMGSQGNRFSVPHGVAGNMSQSSNMFCGNAPSDSRIHGFPAGMFVGGCTPQAQRMQQLMSLSQGLSGAQLATLVQSLQEQLTMQTRMTPEHFGQLPFELGESRDVVAPLDFGRDGTHNEAPHSSYVDVFSKSEKRIGSPPQPNFETWSSRESEVIGWASFRTDLSGWAAQASIEFSMEIDQSARWPRPILWEGLSPARRARSMRSHAILKSSLQEHARTSNLLKAFNEGISLEGGMTGVDPSQVGNGFGLLRQITNE